MPEDISNLDRFRFSGHESFPCRYAWLPKAFRALIDDENALVDIERAMVTLGVGKNMVQSIRFWLQVMDIAYPDARGVYRISHFGHALLNQLDPFLEDIRTLWLIHWKIATNKDRPLFAWYYLIYHWHTEFSKTTILDAFKQITERLSRGLSTVTLEQHFEVFLHTYVPTRGNKGEFQEDNLDCPLVELGLIEKVGERIVDDSNKREAVYAFRLDEKPEITPTLFVYCLQEFWEKYYPNEQTLTFRHVAFSPGSPGQVFKLPEWDIRQRLECIYEDSGKRFSYKESANIQSLIRNNISPLDSVSKADLLSAVFGANAK